MVYSMTGYGGATLSNENYKVSVELKSLNSKFVEINMKLPRTYMQQEMPLRNILTKKLQRGKVNAVLDVEVLNPTKQRLSINEPLVRSYFDRLENLRQELGIQSHVEIEYLLSLPDALRTDDQNSDPEEWELIHKAFKQAAERLNESRRKEGEALEADLRNSARRIGENLEAVKELLPARTQHVRDRLNNALQELRERTQIDGNRFEQELIYYIEKLDINEEIVRLTKHLEYFRNTVEEGNGSSGKKLGFIAQEMGREINTIGSKANNAGIQVCVVKMKEDLEKIKEQILNIV